MRMISALFSHSDVIAMLSCLSLESRKRASRFVIIAPCLPGFEANYSRNANTSEMSWSLSSKEGKRRTQLRYSVWLSTHKRF